MVNTLFFLFINLFLLFCLITTSSAPDNGTPAQYDLLGDWYINCTGSNCASKHINKRANAPFCTRPGERNKCDVCTPGYTLCLDTCDRNSCGMGSCEVNPNNCSEYTCKCYEGYIGKPCVTCAPGYVKDTFYTYDCIKDKCGGETCNGRGTCVMKFHEPFCICKQGYYGKSCEVPDNCLGDHCTPPLEECVTRELGKGKCECIIGYIRNMATKKCEKNLCASITCPVNEACVKKGNETVACECVAGYARNSTTKKCEEDVCTSDGCRNNEECVRRGESSKCECKQGYIEHKGQCVEDKCKKDPCNRHGACYMKVEEAHCDCYSNYTGDYCKDCVEGFENDRGTNECIESLCDKSTCNRRGVCFMENGKPKCENCSFDYTGDHCEVPPNPCDDKHNKCPKNSRCQRGDADKIEFKCVCKKGNKDKRCDEWEDFRFHYNVLTRKPSQRVKYFSPESTGVF